MIEELDTVVLLRDIQTHQLEQGDIGVVVHHYKDGETFEVEFLTGEGKTVGGAYIGSGGYSSDGRS